MNEIKEIIFAIFLVLCLLSMMVIIVALG